MDISLAPNILTNIYGFPITNTFVWTIFLSLVLVGFFGVMRLFWSVVPGRAQSVVELLIGGGFSFVESVIGDYEKAKKAFPLVMTFFIFILLANLFTFMPGQGAISIKTEGGSVSLFRAVMSDYGMVFALTMITVITVQVIAIIVNGPLGYLGKFINFKSPLSFILGVMDIIVEFAKILSLSFRLFGNIFAGEVLGGVMLFLMPFVVPTAFLFLGVLSAVIQAFVFSVLTLVFISQASEKIN
ncbi:MAG: hypothetical protein COV57_02095 [Candidatus Liptonbacteria bacterium CG11_big_fil_rev_8_21_14_0_20_35_14]|uniref:ATP synthase subunit a n=1 Tax=Candidatus Liptonbacteria bacterium CG11_big_fil_rev_8_21_14_0_20_35_14 TaxID=1974634 RepID=A0A2H0N7M6_9BACT|nr:MAG: hypothetical protein COV57_02095 [Candidatus Liptonbacteria bacterium CG11_big_fil_rev_8_21_14_0_20_35_14]